MPKVLKESSSLFIAAWVPEPPSQCVKRRQNISPVPLMIAGMVLDSRISQTTGLGWGILILSLPISNFQCLCSAEPLSSVRAEQTPVLMDLLNHKNCLQNCIWLKQENGPLFRKISLQRLTGWLKVERCRECPDGSCGISLSWERGRSSFPPSPSLLLSPPQVLSPSAICDERKIDINHFVIDLYDNTWLAKAQHVWQGTAVLEDSDMGVGIALKSPGCPLPRDLHGASTSTVVIEKAFSAQLDQPLSWLATKYKKENWIIPLIKATH